MKKNIKYIFAAVAGLWLTGCTDELDRFPLSSLSPETYFNNEEELRLSRTIFTASSREQGLVTENPKT